MSRMLSKMNLISVVQQLPKDDIETIQGYVEMIEEENQQLKKQLKEQIKEYQKAVDKTMSEKIDVENNWNKLKKYIKTEIPEDVFIDTEWFISILDKMHELEQESDYNE